MAYTYLIGWTALNKWYYGARWAENSNPSDLWNTYFTSSKNVKEFRQIYGEPNIIQVRKEFESGDKAFRWESKVLTRLGIPNNKKFLNKSRNQYKTNAVPWNKGIIGVIKSTEETKNKISKSLLGKPKSKDSSIRSGLSRRGIKRTPLQIKNLSESHKGYIWSSESKIKLSETNKGKKFSNEHKKSISAVALARPKLSCLRCKKIFTVNSFSNHFKYCKGIHGTRIQQISIF